MSNKITQEHIRKMGTCLLYYYLETVQHEQDLIESMMDKIPARKDLFLTDKLPDNVIITKENNKICLNVNFLSDITQSAFEQFKVAIGKEPISEEDLHSHELCIYFFTISCLLIDEFTEFFNNFLTNKQL